MENGHGHAQKADMHGLMHSTAPKPKNAPVHMNGYVSLGDNYKKHSPPSIKKPFPENVPLIAPFFADGETNKGGEAAVYYRSDNSTNLLAKASRSIGLLLGNQDEFEASRLFLVTWFNTSQFGATGSDLSLAGLFRSAHYGLVLPNCIGNKCFELKKDVSYRSRKSKKISKTAGFSGRKGQRNYTIPGSGTMAVLSLVNTSNVHVPGMWIYSLSREIIPKVRPRNVEASSISSTSLNVSWDPPRRNEANEDIPWYSIRYRRVNCDHTSTNLTKWMFKIVNGALRYTTVVDLAKWSCYAVQVFPLNISKGSWSEEIQIRTSEDAPTAGPLDVKVSNTSSTSLVVTWDPPFRNETHGKIRKYCIRYRKVDCKSTSSNLTAWNLIDVNGTTRSTAIKGLTKWSCYAIQVSAGTVKNGKWSTEVQHRTNEDAPTAGPLNVKASNTSSTSLTVTWDLPPQNETYGIIRKYCIRYRKVNCKMPLLNLTQWTFVCVNGTTNFTTIKGLQKWSCYAIKVNAVTIKNGKWSSRVQYRTSEDAPSAGPLNVKVSNTSSESIKVTWDPPCQKETHGKIREYSIRYRKVDCSSSSKNLTTWNYLMASGTVRSFDITSLAKWSCYGIQIRAVTIKNGKWSDEISQRTSEYDPAGFVTHPKNQLINMGDVVQLSCSFYKNTGQDFYWKRDGERLTDGTKVLPPADNTNMSTFKKGNRIISQLSLLASKPDIQGLYSCEVKDKTESIKSKEGRVQLNGVSTTKMVLTIDRTFEKAIHDKDSQKFMTFERDVIELVNASLNKRGTTGRKTFALRNIRSGSIVVDVYIYFMGLNSSDQSNLCSEFENFIVPGVFGSMKIKSINTTTLGCCSSSKTGEEQLKGVIAWPSTLADTNSTVDCPFNDTKIKFRHAVRFCRSDEFFGAIWNEANINNCPYKTKTTRALEKISHAVVNESNAEFISEQLNDITKNPTEITNLMDVKFIADTVERLVHVKRTLQKTVHNILNSTSSLLQVPKKTLARSQGADKSSTRLLHALQSLADNIPVQQNETISVPKKSIAMKIIMVNPKDITGLSITAVSTAQPNVNYFAPDSSTHKPRSVIAKVYLPGPLFDKINKSQDDVQRVTVFVFDNEKLFLTNVTPDNSTSSKRGSSKAVGGRIVSVSIKGSKLRNLSGSEQIRTTFSTSTPSAKRHAECVFWDFNAAGGQGKWSPWGCWSDGYDKNSQAYKCRCNHLTHFAILLNLDSEESTLSEAKSALRFITYIGCGISLVSLVFTFSTFAIFRKLRMKQPQKILMHLCFALIALLIVLLAGFGAKNQQQCQVFSVLTHYFVLASFFWMGVEGVNIYLCVVKVMNSKTSKFVWKASAVAWGIPVFMVGITAGVTKLEPYAEEGHDGWICMVKGTPFYASYLTPILLITICNLVILVMVFLSLAKQSKLPKSNYMEMSVKVRMAAALSVVMGTTWIIGLFAVGKLTLAFQIIFCVLNTLQGFFIFVFYCARIKDVRDEWKRCFKEWKKCLGCETEDTGLPWPFFEKRHSLGVAVMGNPDDTLSTQRDSLAFLSDDSFSLSNYGNYRTMPESSRKVIYPKEKTAGLKTTPGKEIEETNFNGTRAAPETIENNNRH